ncbi:MAG: hypothetical protein AAF589_07200, partial [Planctomycetota bacterium]
MSASLPCHHSFTDEPSRLAYAPATQVGGGASIAIADQPDTLWPQQKALRLSAPEKTGGTGDEARHQIRLVDAPHGVVSNQRVQNVPEVHWYAAVCMTQAAAPFRNVFFRCYGDSSQRIQIDRQSNGEIVAALFGSSTQSYQSAGLTIPLGEVFEIWCSYVQSSGSDGVFTLRIKRRSDAAWVTFIDVTNHGMTNNIGGIAPYSFVGGGLTETPDGTYNLETFFLEFAAQREAYPASGPTPIGFASRAIIQAPRSDGAKASLILEPNAYRNAAVARVVYGVGDRDPSLIGPWTPLVAFDEADMDMPVVHLDMVGLPPGQLCTARYELAAGAAATAPAHTSEDFHFRTLPAAGDSAPIHLSFGCCSDQYSGKLACFGQKGELAAALGKPITKSIFIGDLVYENPAGYANGSVLENAQDQVARTSLVGLLSYYYEWFSLPDVRRRLQSGAFDIQEDDHPLNDLDTTWIDDEVNDLNSIGSSWWSGSTVTLGEAWRRYEAIRLGLFPAAGRPVPGQAYREEIIGQVRLLYVDTRFTSDRTAGTFIDAAQQAWLYGRINNSPEDAPYNVLVMQGIIDNVANQGDSPSNHDLDGCRALFQWIADNAPSWSRWLFVQGDTHTGPYAHTRFEGTNGTLITSDKLVASVNCSPIAQPLASVSPVNAVLALGASRLYETSSLVDNSGSLSTSDVIKTSGVLLTIEPANNQIGHAVWAGETPALVVDHTQTPAAVPYPGSTENSQQLRTDIADELSRLDASISSRATPNDVGGGGSSVAAAFEQSADGQPIQAFPPSGVTALQLRVQWVRTSDGLYLTNDGASHVDPTGTDYTSVTHGWFTVVPVGQVRSAEIVKPAGFSNGDYTLRLVSSSALNGASLGDAVVSMDAESYLLAAQPNQGASSLQTLA